MAAKKCTYYTCHISNDNGTSFVWSGILCSPSPAEIIVSTPSASGLNFPDFCAALNAAVLGTIVSPRFTMLPVSTFFKNAALQFMFNVLDISLFSVGTRFYIGAIEDNRYVRIDSMNVFSNAVQIASMSYWKDDSQLFTYSKSINIGTQASGGYSPSFILPWAWWESDSTHYYLNAIKLSTSYDAGNDQFTGVSILYWLNSAVNADTILKRLWDRWIEGLVEPDVDDPYIDIADSEPSGPAEGVGIPSSDPVDFPGLPSFSATDTGFITLFNPTLAQVKALADYMWNGLFDLNNFKKILADPMDCILGFNMLPVTIPNSGAKDVCIGNIVSTVSMNLASSQWVEVDCGQLDLGLPYGSYLDFSPYTKYSIYLPYIGTCDLSADDVAGKVLRLKYHVDILSCSCVAYLKCGDSVLYQWTGSCGYSIPVTQNDFSRMIMSIVSMAAGAIGGAITAGGGLASVAGFARGGAESAAKNVMGLKPDVHRSGSIGSSAGLMGGQTPYLILEVPKACKPAKQYHYLGYPSFTTVKLGDVSGRQDFESVILDGIPCTEEERDMIAAACEGGIYL